MVGLSIMGAAAPSMMTMSLAPFEAQKRAQNLGIAESSAVTFAAKHEGAAQLADPPNGCELDKTNAPAIEITCTKGIDTKYVQTVSRSFRLASSDLSCDDNDGNNGHGNSGGNDCSNPGNGGYANNVRVFQYPSPPGYTGTECLNTENWGLDTSAFDRAKNKWKGKSCTPYALTAQAWYDASSPDAWMYDINGERGYGPHSGY
jgi:hypothetical protein